MCLAMFSAVAFSTSNGGTSFRYLWSSLSITALAFSRSDLKSRAMPTLSSASALISTSIFQLWPWRFSHAPWYPRRLCADEKHDVIVSSYIPSVYHIQTDENQVEFQRSPILLDTDLSERIF